MGNPTHIDVAYRNLANATQRLRTAVANLRPGDPASMKALEDAKAAWDDALATFRKAAGLITILATFPVLGAQLVG